jgi:hypothetical protein
MAMLDVPSTFPTIRSAIEAAMDGDQIYIAAGTYDIRDLFAAGDKLAPPTFAYTTNLGCLTGFTTVTTLMYSGDVGGSTYNPITKITGNARLFVSNQDSRPPVQITFDNLEFECSSASSNYLFQTGQFNQNEAQTLTDVISLNNVKFTGTHVGNAGANGNYMAVIGIEQFGLSDSVVELTGQSGFTGTQAMTGGSSFLLLQGGKVDGGSLVINGSKFDESGYRNGLSIFDSLSVNVGTNSFYRSNAATRYARSRMVSGAERFNVGNKISNSNGSMSGNNFYDGSYLVLERTTGNTSALNISGTHFHQWDASVSPSPTPIIGGGAVGISLEGTSGATYPSFSGNFFDYVNPINNYTTAVSNIVSGGSQITNPSTNTRVNISTFRAGGTGNDVITGSNNTNEWFNGGTGNDQINTGFGTSNPDYVFFNTALNASTNVDTVTNLNLASSLTGDRIVLDRKYFPGITAHFNSGAGVVGGVGAISANDILNDTTDTTTDPTKRLVYNRNTGSLLYNPVGSTVAGDEILFARLFSDHPGTTAAADLIGFTGANASTVNISII